MVAFTRGDHKSWNLIPLTCLRITCPIWKVLDMVLKIYFLNFQTHQFSWISTYISAFSKYTKILQALYSMWHFTWISTYGGEATSLCSMNAMFCSSWALYQKLGHREEIPVAEIYTRLCHVLLYGLEYWKGWDFSSSSSTGSVGGLWYLEDKQTHGLFPFLTIK